MVKIRLRRTGSKKQASYRVVVAPSTAPRDGRFIEIIGYYHPRQDPPLVFVKEDRLFYWLSVGAQPSDSVNQLLKSKGVLDRYAQYKAGELVLDETLAETASDEAPSAEVDSNDSSTAEEASAESESTEPLVAETAESA